MTRIYALIALACLLLGACATAPDDGTTPTDTTGMGGSTTTTTPPAVTPPAMDPTPAPTSPCAGTPTDDGLECTTWECVGNTWMNTTSCQTGYACTNTGCVLVAPTTPTPAPNACGNGICETALGECVENCPADCHPVVVTPTCGDKICNNGETTATCAMDCPAPPVVVTKPTMTGELKDGQILVSLTGPVLKTGLVKASVTDPGYIQYGSDWDVGNVAGNWSLPYASGKWMSPWPTDFLVDTTANVITFYLPLDVNSFTFYLANKAKTDGSWFQNSKWDVKGILHFCDAVAKDKICH